MKNKLFAILAGLLLLAGTAAAAGNPKVRFETSQGPIVVELYPVKAPQTVENFLGYVKAGHYDGLIFHRVIAGFMIQGGGMTADMQERSTGKPIPNEADNGLQNRRGTLAMARTNDPHSATSQFFINTVDNFFLDHKGKNPRGWGYCVFGKVVEGMDTVAKIAASPTTQRGAAADVPVEPVTIVKAAVVE